MIARRAVLVFLPLCPDSVGEQVVQLPFFHFLREAHPGALVVAVAPERSSAVFEALGTFDAVFAVPRGAGWGEQIRTIRALRAWRIERVYQLRKKSLRAALFARAATSAKVDGFRYGANAVLQQRSTTFDLSRYIAESYAGILGRTTQEYADAVRAPAEGYAVFVPLGRTPIKSYPMERYVDVARELSRRLPVRVLLGPAMEGTARALAAANADLDVRVAPPIPDVARLLSRASLVIANDCGPAHFAHVADVPRISLFDRSIDAGHWFFAGRHGRLLQSPGAGRIAEIPVEDILRHAQQLLTGSSVGLRGSRPME